MMIPLHYRCIALLLVIFFQISCGWPSSGEYDQHLSHGFTELPFNTSFYHFQKPFDRPLEERYSFINGVHRLWVFSSDKPLSKNSPTNPRTEVIISGYGYSSGVWEFQGDFYVPRGTSGVCIMQVFGAAPPRATTFMLRVYNGTLTYYRAPVLVASDIYDRWFRLNVIHDVGNSNVKVYIDGCLRYEAPGRGGDFHYFKYGVYAQDKASSYMESRWKNVRIFRQ